MSALAPTAVPNLNAPNLIAPNVSGPKVSGPNVNEHTGAFPASASPQPVVPPQLVVSGKGITKSYYTGRMETRVLEDVSLQVAQGEFLYLVGPSGSGKTTLLSILGCVLTADTGSLQLAGQDVTRLSDQQRTRFRCHNIGFVFQRFHLFGGLTAWENVAVAFRLLGVPGRKARTESLELLARVGLSNRSSHKISQLSIGQRQRVALARALAGNPPLILADEPTASLDAESGLQAVQLLRTLCQEIGTTVVVVTHDDRIKHLADRVLSLSEGRIVGELSREARILMQEAGPNPEPGRLANCGV